MTKKQDRLERVIEEVLKPCPFCGEIKYLNIHKWLGYSGRELARDTWTVDCDGCNFEGPKRDSKTKAIKDWNTRDSSQILGMMEIRNGKIVLKEK